MKWIFTVTPPKGEYSCIAYMDQSEEDSKLGIGVNNPISDAKFKPTVIDVIKKWKKSLIEKEGVAVVEGVNYKVNDGWQSKYILITGEAFLKYHPGNCVRGSTNYIEIYCYPDVKGFYETLGYEDGLKRFTVTGKSTKNSLEMIEENFVNNNLFDIVLKENYN